jgi:hypothetical protein
MTLIVDDMVKRFYAPNGVKNHLECTLMKRKSKFGVTGHFTVVSIKPTGVKAKIILDDHTLKLHMRDDLRQKATDVS